MMYPSDHPTTAMVLARHRKQEDIARAEAYRAARKARAARAARAASEAARDSRAAAQTRGIWLFLRGATSGA